MPSRFQLDEDDNSTHQYNAGGSSFVQTPEHIYAAVYSKPRLWLRGLVKREVEREMPLLVAIQRTCRSPVLDRFFIFTGLLGNHTFFMIMLPLLHVYGLGMFARGLTFVVLWSVYLSGVAKDYISAPRPTSPPVAHITRSPAHTFEYGFPSSHTTYVVASILYVSHFMVNVWSFPFTWALILWTIGFLIVVGRVYCGLHSFIDIAGGVVIGAVEALLFVLFFEPFDNLLMSAAGPLYMAVILYLALSSIPRSLDLCPCCIDSFCATAVTFGISTGAWMHARIPFLWKDGVTDCIAWDWSLSMSQNALRFLIIVGMIVVWKVQSKPFIVSLLSGLAYTREASSLSVGSDPAPHYNSESDSSTVVGGETNHGSDDHVNDKARSLLIEDYQFPSEDCIRDGRYGTHKLIYSPENIARIPVYAGIGIIMYVVAPTAYFILGLKP